MSANPNPKRSIRSSFGVRLRRFHADERGDEGVNKILIIALIVIPIVIVLILFGKEIVGWFKTAWSNLSGEGGVEPSAP